MALHDISTGSPGAVDSGCKGGALNPPRDPPAGLEHVAWAAGETRMVAE